MRHLAICLIVVIQIINAIIAILSTYYKIKLARNNSIKEIYLHKQYHKNIQRPRTKMLGDKYKRNQKNNKAMRELSQIEQGSEINQCQSSSIEKQELQQKSKQVEREIKFAGKQQGEVVNHIGQDQEQLKSKMHENGQQMKQFRKQQFQQVQIQCRICLQVLKFVPMPVSQQIISEVKQQQNGQPCMASQVKSCIKTKINKGTNQRQFRDFAKYNTNISIQNASDLQLFHQTAKIKAPQVIALDSNSPYLSPCRCTGSLKYIHEQCLKEWLQKLLPASLSVQYNLVSSIKCQLCRQPIYFTITSYNKCLTLQEFGKNIRKYFRTFILLLLLLIVNLAFFSALLNYLLFVGFTVLKDNNVVLVSLIISGQVIFSIVSVISLVCIWRKFFVSKTVAIESILIRRSQNLAKINDKKNKKIKQLIKNVSELRKNQKTNQEQNDQM